jgi:hypothetical protein
MLLFTIYTGHMLKVVNFAHIVVLCLKCGSMQILLTICISYETQG